MNLDFKNIHIWCSTLQTLDIFTHFRYTHFGTMDIQNKLMCINCAVFRALVALVYILHHFWYKVCCLFIFMVYQMMLPIHMEYAIQTIHRIRYLRCSFFIFIRSFLILLVHMKNASIKCSMSFQMCYSLYRRHIFRLNFI